MLAGGIGRVNSSRVSRPKLRISRGPGRLIGIKARGAPSSYGFAPCAENGSVAIDARKRQRHPALGHGGRCCLPWIAPGADADACRALWPRRDHRRGHLRACCRRGVARRHARADRVPCRRPAHGAHRHVAGRARRANASCRRRGRLCARRLPLGARRRPRRVLVHRHVARVGGHYQRRRGGLHRRLHRVAGQSHHRRRRAFDGRHRGTRHSRVGLVRRTDDARRAGRTGHGDRRGIPIRTPYRLARTRDVAPFHRSRRLERHFHRFAAGRIRIHRLRGDRQHRGGGQGPQPHTAARHPLYARHHHHPLCAGDVGRADCCRAHGAGCLRRTDRARVRAFDRRLPTYHERDCHRRGAQRHRGQYHHGLAHHVRPIAAEAFCRGRSGRSAREPRRP